MSKGLLKPSIIVFSLVFSIQSALFCQPETLIILADTEKQSLESSSLLKAYEFDENALKYKAKSVGANLYPRLSIEGSYTYIDVVPEIDMPLISPRPVKLSDNTNYSVGPVLRWTVWGDTYGILKKLAKC
ncbi:TolC family protein [Elusimicrobiota bacterium]